jgi:hypothetical protein
MMLPPTALPTRLRLFVDPPPETLPVYDLPPVIVSPPRWRRLRSIARPLLKSRAPKAETGPDAAVFHLGGSGGREYSRAADAGRKAGPLPLRSGPRRGRVRLPRGCTTRRSEEGTHERPPPIRSR